MSTSTSPAFPYQPALDGLRAIGVLTVMLYHAGVSWLPGGFFGVDVFFVLSGFLITSLLWIEGSRTGGVRLIRFWSRRLRRLYPALLLCVLGVVGYGYWLAEPEELARLRVDGLSALFYVSNWQFIFNDLSYFDQFNAPSPLLHTWSLAIEEQWYLLWPLVVIGLLRIPRGSPARLSVAALFAAAASALWMAWNFDPETDPSRVYYGTDTRAQNLLVGSALAFWLRAHPDRRVPQWLGGVALAGLALLMVATHDHAPWVYRGGFALVAITTATIIAVAVQPSGWLRTCLSVAPMQFIGRISYGMYLWHWPIYIVLTPDRVGVEGAALLVLRFSTTIAISTLSYYSVERPIRAGALEGIRIRALGVGTVGIMAFLFLSMPVAPETEDPAEIEIAAPSGNGDAAGKQGAIAGSANATSLLRVMVVGDSIAYTLATSFRRDLVDPPLYVMQRATIGCGAGRGKPMYGGGALYTWGSECAKWPAPWSRAAWKMRPEIALILLGAWEVVDRLVDGRRLRVWSPEYKDYIVKELELGLEGLFAADTHAVILSTPCMNQKKLELAQRRPTPRRARNRPRAVAWVNKIFREVAERNPERMTFIDLNGFMCPDGPRPQPIEGIMLQSDGVHFSKEGGAVVWRWLAPQLVEIADGVRSR